MRRLTATVVCVACGASAAAAGEPPTFNAMCGEVACRVERVPAKWQLLSVDRDLPILKIVYESGGCRRGKPRLTVVESASRVRIEVDQEEVVAMDTPDGVPVCPLDLRYGRFNVLLKRAIAGRPIVGGPRIAGNLLVYDRAKVVDGRVIPLVPRVGDLAARDAVRVLKFQGFHVRRIGGPSGRVAFQTPLPGRLARGRAVRLTIGFGAFDARAIESCLEHAGVPTKVRRPRPGDEDAPDLDLWLGAASRPPFAFVAFYRDPARLREQAPSLRRNARRFHGIVERVDRRISVVWVTRPSPARHGAVHGCIAGAKP